MNTKGMKFLAVLAVLAMAFAAFAVVAPAETDDAATATSVIDASGTVTAAATEQNVAIIGGATASDAIAIAVNGTTTSGTTGAINLYLLEGTFVTIAITPSTYIGTITLYTATAADKTAKTYTAGPTTLALTLISNSDVAATAVSANSDGTVLKADAGLVSTGTYALSVAYKGTDHTTVTYTEYYSVAPSAMEIDDKDVTATLNNGSIEFTIKYKNNAGGAEFNTGSNIVKETVKVAFENVTKTATAAAGAAPYTVTTYENYEDANILNFIPNVAGKADGDISVTGTGVIAVYNGNGSSTAQTLSTTGSISAIFTNLGTTTFDGTICLISTNAALQGVAYLSGSVSKLPYYTGSGTAAKAVDNGTVAYNIFAAGDCDVGDLNVPQGTNKTVQFYGGSSGTLTVQQGSQLTDVITLSVTDYTGPIAGVSTGSVAIGTTEGTVSLISGNFTINNLTVAAGATMIVQPTSTLVLTGNATVAAKTTSAPAGIMYLYGVLDASGAGVSSSAPLSLVVKGTFMAFADSEMTANVKVCDFNGTGTVDFSNAMRNKIIEGSADVGVYYQMQNVIVQDHMDITYESTVRIYGTLNVPADTVLTVKRNATLIINSDTALLNVAGSVVVEDGAKLIITDLRNSNITGTIEIEDGGELYVAYQENATATSIAADASLVMGQLVLSDGSKLVVAGKVFTAPRAAGYGTDTKTYTLNAKNGSTIQINGDVLFAATSMYSEGLIVLDEATVATSTINVGGKAEVDVDEIVFAANSSTLTISDVTNELLISAHENDKAGITGLVVKDSYTAETESTAAYNTMDLSGTLDYTTLANANNKPTVTITGAELTVTDSLYLEDGVTLSIGNVATTAMTVSGNIYAVNTGSVVNVASGSTIVTVTGLIVTETAIEHPQSLIAAYYKAKDLSRQTFYYYTNLTSALEADATDITLYGAYNVDKNTVIPAETVITVDSGITIGYGDTSVIMKFEDGAVLKGESVRVYGTLEFENKKNNRATAIYSDVSVIGTKSSSYTNIYTALNSASAGDEVKITSTEKVTLNSNVTVKDGVDLVAPAGTKLALADGVTLTINGTIMAYSGIEGNYDAETLPAKLVVNGIFKTGETSELDDLYDKYGVDGMYYRITDDNGVYAYISPLSIAVDYVSDAQGKSIYAYGDVTSEAVAIAGSSSSAVKIVVTAESSLGADVAASYASVIATNGGYTGTFSDANGSINVSNVEGITLADGKYGLVVSGTLAKFDAEEDAKVTVSNGEVIASKLNVPSAIKSFTVSKGAEMNVVGVSDFNALKVDGLVCVMNGKEAVSSTDLSKAAGKLTAGTITVMGDLYVLPANTEDGILNAGILDVTKLFIGITKTGAIGDGASVLTESVGSSIEAIYVKAGSSISEAAVAAMKSTTFTVEGALYMTVYVPAGSTLTIGSVVVPDVASAYGDKWLVDGKDASDKKIAGGYNAIAEYTYDIYTIEIYTDAGVKSVAINGIELETGFNTNVFTTVNKLPAGTYTVAYTLASGYTGEATLYAYDTHTILKDNKFTLSGTEGYKKVDNTTYLLKLQLTGTEQSVAPEPSPVEQNEWTITTILLVILVILIAIMAVIVALRLNRS